MSQAACNVKKWTICIGNQIVTPAKLQRHLTTESFNYRMLLPARCFCIAKRELMMSLQLRFLVCPQAVQTFVVVYRFRRLSNNEQCMAADMVNDTSTSVFQQASELTPAYQKPPLKCFYILQITATGWYTCRRKQSCLQKVGQGKFVEYPKITISCYC